MENRTLEATSFIPIYPNKLKSVPRPSGALAGEHLTDQLHLPFALAGGGTFTAERLNLRSRTNMEIIRCVLRVDFVTSQEGPLTRVAIKPLFVTPRCR